MPSEPKKDLFASLQIASGEAITIEAAGEEEENKLPRFEMLAYTGGMMDPGWGYPVVVEVKGMKVLSKSVPIRLQHMVSQGLGHTDSVRKENYQIRASGVFSRDNEYSREVVTASKNGFPWQSSIGVSVKRHEFVEEGKKLRANGQVFEGPVFVVRESVLNEISFVELGADRETSARVAAELSGGISMADEAKKDGKAPDIEAGNTDTETKKPDTTVEASGDKKETSAPVDVDLQASREKLAAEAERIDAIREACGGNHAKIEAEAIREGWSKEKAELAVLRAERKDVPNAHRSEPELSSSVIEASLSMACGMGSADLEKGYDEQTLEAANKQFGSGLSLTEVLIECARANGYSGRGVRDNLGRIMEFAFRGNRTLEAGFSNADISGILSNVANKHLLRGFMSVESAWRRVAAVRPVNDFKQVTSYRMTGNGTFTKVGPGGELKHGTLGEESFTNQADTYGVLYGITRKDIINDDLGAISTVPRKIGADGAKTFNTLFWTEFLDDASFFTAGNANYITGTDTVLGIDGLTEGEQTFMDMTDPDGDPIGHDPRILLVPTALSAKAAQLMKSTEVRDTTSSTNYGTANPHSGKFETVVSRYLTSATAWWLLGDPNDIPVIEAAFLYGKDTPTVEQADADFNTLGIQMRGFFDFGISKQDYRGGVKSKGAA